MKTENENKQALSGAKKTSSFLEKLLTDLEKLTKPEEKIQHILAFMKAALSDYQAPRFRDFWDGKKVCLPFFKEVTAPQVRSKLWAEYIEVSQEGRQLKQILEEKASFAVEQIELAIKAIESDLNRDDFLKQIPEIDLDGLPLTESDAYSSSQQQLEMLNLFAAKIVGLRKELIKTEMRARHKGKLFDRLSQLGDRVFPKRKELIQKVSSLFMADIEKFEKNLLEPQKNVKLFDLFHQIKGLQSLAKLLTLDKQTFTQTRLVLNRCWEALKEREKEQKEHWEQKHQVYEKNLSVVLEKVKLLEQKCQDLSYTWDEAIVFSNEITTFMKTVELGKVEVAKAREAIQKARSPLNERLEKEQQVRDHALKEEQRLKQEALAEFKKEVEEAMAQSSQHTVEELIQKKEVLTKQLELLNLTATEREVYSQLLKRLRDKIVEKKEASLANLSEDQKKSLEDLRSILEERKIQRQEIRAEIEHYRKLLAGSGFDFEKAMQYREIIDTEKERLTRVLSAIEEIEEKIEEIEE